jgi:hypothetical protein
VIVASAATDPVAPAGRGSRFDFCPAFWDWLDREAGKSQLICVRPIYDELADQKDDLAAWIKDRNPSPLVVKADDERTQAAFRGVAAHVDGRRGHYTDEAVAEFLAGGDPWLIAFAAANGHIVITHELSQPASK